MKKRADKLQHSVGDYVRISLSIPRDIWPWFERQSKKPQHMGNRSSYVRSLIVSAMAREKRAKLPA